MAVERIEVGGPHRVACRAGSRPRSVAGWGQSGVAERNGSVVRRIQLGRALRELRETAGLSVEVSAPQLDWSSSKLSRIENGQQAVDVHGVRSMLDLYGAGGERWTELIELTRQTRQKGWWRAYGLDDLGYVPLETEASLVRDFTLAYVPGLLQTADYARAVFRSGLRQRTDAEVANDVTVRMIRARHLTTDTAPLELVAIVDEAVLHRPVGGAAVHRAQLAHLVWATALPAVTLQVLPRTGGSYPGMSAVFTVLSFGDLGVADMVYVEHPMGAVHMEKAADVARATLTLDHLRSLALSPGDSVALIERVAAQS